MALDQNPTHIDFIESRSQMIHQDDFKPGDEDLGLILSPGIPRTHPVVQNFLKRGLPVKDEIDLALDDLKKVPIIALTGTNGKTTTTMMIGALLEAMGKRPVLAGNIGLPLSESRSGARI